MDMNKYVVNKESFKVTLVNAHIKSDDYLFNNPTEHLGLGYIASYLLNEGFTTDIIDGYALNLGVDDIVEEICINPPSIMVGITCEFNTFLSARLIASKIRSRLPELSIVLGGEHATFAAEEILTSCDCFDCVVRGEGEITCHELVEALETGGSLDNIDGIYYRISEHGKVKIIKNKDRKAVENIDSLPYPSRITIEKCLSRGMNPAIIMLGSRGCPSVCKFCNAYKFFNIGGGARWRARSPENIIIELEEIIHLYQRDDVYPLIYFADENFVGYRRPGLIRMERFAKLLIEKNLNISYEIFCRTDSFYKSPDLVNLLKKSGLVSVLMGIEAGSASQLKDLRKGANINHNYESIRIFRQNNIATTSSGFLMFNPYSSFDDLHNNAKFLLEIGHSTIYNMSCRIFAYPGIDMVDDLKRDNMLKVDFSHFNTGAVNFMNKNVELIANLLNNHTDLSMVRREDSTMRHIDMNFSRLTYEMGEILVNNTSVKRLKLEESRDSIQKLSNNFFLNLLDMAEKNKLCEKSFGVIYANYNLELKINLDELDSEFYNFLSDIPNLIEEGMYQEMLAGG